MKLAWETKRLGDVAEVVNGGTPKTGEPSYWGGKHAWITPKDLGQLDAVLVEETGRTLTAKGLTGSSATLVPVGSVILSTRAPIGHLAMNTVPMAFNQGCRGLIPSKSLDAKFLFYFLYASVGLLNELGTGATFKELSAGALKKVELPLPPLAEQRRIVEVLDEAFAALATATTNTEQALTDARELFEAALTSTFRKLADGGTPMRCLDDLTCTGSKITYGVVKPGPAGDVPFVRGGDIKNGVVAIDELRTITTATSRQYARTLLNGGEILICLVGVPGQTAVAPKHLKGANIARQVGLIRLRSGLDPEFISLYLRSALGQAALGLHTGGSVQQVINLGDLRTVEVPVPEPSTQGKAVEALREIEEDCRKAEALMTTKLTLLAELRQSLLSRAFAGELT